MSDFKFAPSQYVPFRDVEAIARCRAIKREDIAKHPNKDLKIQVLKDVDVPFMKLTDMVARIKKSSDEGSPLVMIVPNPVPGDRHVARLINAMRLNCKNVHLFAMDEYANENGRDRAGHLGIRLRLCDEEESGLQHRSRTCACRRKTCMYLRIKTSRITAK